ncbi:acyl-CoA dehydrogenase family protein [Parasphingopyxis lamellibrachiae]|uniref:Acyl-CoA dehydrogenase n=1 Tax=Parasphingopyxis lamellibrachiae TaxID=680125 RepID=A0A3D9FGV8_9SPHN|nr:acyl-CoA dehydrogenase family protein [Parasphingopyxis lamellibrachiae]RED16331.1 acyl-CoA dehydrogenase [Parasphingopyxis lamellibrachiae]
MSEHRAMLLDMVDKLFTKLVENGVRDNLSAEDFSRHWRAIEGLGLTRLLIPEQAGGFDGNWEDAGPVFKALGSYGITLPLGENILAQHWLHRLGQDIPEGIIQPAFAESRTGDVLVLRNGAGFAKAQWIFALEPDRWSLLPTGNADRSPSAKSGAVLRCNISTSVANGPLETGDRAFFSEAALMRACQIAGATETMLRITLGHALDRTQFGRPLARFQAIQHQLAMLAEENAAASCATASACQAALAGDAQFEMAAAKFRANRAATLAADIAHQVHGAIGFTREYSLRHFSQQAQAWAREFGNERHWALWLGRFALEARPDPLWNWLTARSDDVLAREQRGQS